MPFLALEGIRVLDVSTDISGPYCAKMLADYGAEVIKVERPGSGDTSRQSGPFTDNIPHQEKSGLFLHLNRQKRGITLDITNTNGAELFRKLAAQSQVIIENGAPGDMESLGLGYQALSTDHTDLTMISITPFGQSGPYRDHQFTELTIFAMGGAMHREGLPDREPLRYGGEVAQYFTGTAASAATMTAIFQAAMTGQGEWIDISIQECMAGHPHQIGRRLPYIYGGETDPRKPPRLTAAGSREPYAVGTFRCNDGFVSFLPLGPRMWPNLTRMIERPDLQEADRYQTTEGRADYREEIEKIFQEWFDRHSRAEIFEAGQSEGLPCAPIQTTGDALENEQFKSRDYFVDLAHPEAGVLTYPGLPFLYSDMPRSEPTPAPTLGQHNTEVYGDLLGLNEQDLAEFRVRGVV